MEIYQYNIKLQEKIQDLQFIQPSVSIRQPQDHSQFIANVTKGFQLSYVYFKTDHTSKTRAGLGEFIRAWLCYKLHHQFSPT